MTTQPSLTVGSLCTGYGGLDLAARTIFPTARTAWVSDIDPHVNKWLNTRHPDTPNVGDFTLLDQLPACDILTAGFPCQPASTAGERKGIDDDRWLWPAIERTIGRMGRPPSVVLLENVPGLLTVNDGHAMADVVGGLAALGYVGSYGVLGARDVGACHRRDRLWIVAVLDTGHDSGRSELRVESQAWTVGAGQPGEGTRLMPTPRLLPTPVTANNENRQSEGFRPNLGTALKDLLPTPTASEAKGGETPGKRPSGHNKQASVGGSLATLPSPNESFGQYAPAVERWATTIGRPAPEPTDEGRLNPVFVEWMMGLPEGWVTGDDVALSRTQQLRMLGNGVVPQVAVAAYSQLLARIDVAGDA